MLIAGIPWYQHCAERIHTAMVWGGIAFDPKGLAAEVDQHLTFYPRWRSWVVVVIEELGWTFGAESLDEGLAALGRLLVASSLLLHRMQIDLVPIVTFARELQATSDVQPVSAQATLARALRIEDEEVRAPVLVAGLALAIAKALDDIEISHGTAVNPLEVWRIVARERLEDEGVYPDGLPLFRPPPPTPAEMHANVRAAIEASKIESRRVAGERLADGLAQLGAAEAAEGGGDFEISAVIGTSAEVATKPIRLTPDLGALLATEIAAAHASIDAKEAAFDAHGYGDGSGQVSEVIGLGTPAAVLTSDLLEEMTAKIRDGRVVSLAELERYRRVLHARAEVAPTAAELMALLLTKAAPVDLKHERHVWAARGYFTRLSEIAARRLAPLIAGIEADEMHIDDPNNEEPKK